MNAPDLRTRQFGHLTVTEFAGYGERGPYWYCLCSCGSKRVVRGVDLISGNSSSCGHIRNRGRSKGGKRTAEASAWQNMISRCERSSSISYQNYGARGIMVCSRWRYGEGGKAGFECFLDDVGPRPGDGFSLEREDYNGNYEPGNCRWASRKDQARNRRDNQWLLIDGQKTILDDAIKILRVRKTLCYRLIGDGFSLAEAIRKSARVDAAVEPL